MDVAILIGNLMFNVVTSLVLNRHIVNVNKRKTTCDNEKLGLCLININLSILLSFEICLK